MGQLQAALTQPRDAPKTYESHPGPSILSLSITVTVLRMLAARLQKMSSAPAARCGGRRDIGELNHAARNQQPLLPPHAQWQLLA